MQAGLMIKHVGRTGRRPLHRSSTNQCTTDQTGGPEGYVRTQTAEGSDVEHETLTSHRSDAARGRPRGRRRSESGQCFWLAYLHKCSALRLAQLWVGLSRFEASIRATHERGEGGGGVDTGEYGPCRALGGGQAGHFGSGWRGEAQDTASMASESMPEVYVSRLLDPWLRFCDARGLHMLIGHDTTEKRQLTPSPPPRMSFRGGGERRPLFDC